MGGEVFPVESFSALIEDSAGESEIGSAMTDPHGIHVLDGVQMMLFDSQALTDPSPQPPIVGVQLLFQYLENAVSE